MNGIRTGRNRTQAVCALGASLVAALTVLATAAPASALRLAVSDGGLTAPTSNFGCDSAATDCQAERDFLLDGGGIALGSLELVGDQLSFEITVQSVSFQDPLADPGEASLVSFAGVTYTGSVFALTSGDMATGYSIVVPLAGSASVVGSLQTGDVARGLDGSSTPFAVDAELLNFSCLLLNGTGQCGLQIGNGGFTLPVGDQGHDFVHTFNLTVIPEPSTASLLLFAGLSGLLLLRRRPSA